MLTKFELNADVDKFLKINLSKTLILDKEFDSIDYLEIINPKSIQFFPLSYENCRDKERIQFEAIKDNLLILDSIRISSPAAVKMIAAESSISFSTENSPIILYFSFQKCKKSSSDGYSWEVETLEYSQKGIQACKLETMNEGMLKIKSKKLAKIKLSTFNIDSIGFVFKEGADPSQSFEKLESSILNGQIKVFDEIHFLNPYEDMKFSSMKNGVMSLEKDEEDWKIHLLGSAKKISVFSPGKINKNLLPPIGNRITSFLITNPPWFWIVLPVIFLSFRKNLISIIEWIVKHFKKNKPNE